jgi:hypothetical protein
MEAANCSGLEGGESTYHLPHLPLQSEMVTLINTPMLPKAVLLVTGACALTTACKDKAAHEHAHAQAGSHAAEGLTLNKGKKWPTDAPLRAGMTTIRNELQTAMKPIHENTYSADQYSALAGKIEAQIGSIVANCKLAPEADAQLHVVLSQITAGTDLMKKSGSGLAGATKTFQGLESYAQYFDHPDWKPLEH